MAECAERFRGLWEDEMFLLVSIETSILLGNLFRCRG